MISDTAHQYWKKGFNVIPIRVEPHKNKKWKKSPMVEYKRWWTERQTDVDFKSLPWDEGNGFAVLCGTPNCDGYYFGAIDLDVINVSDEARQLGERVFRELPISQLEATPSGGKHYVYLTKKKASTRNFHDECAIELLGSKKLCVMAPSEGYRRLNDNPLTVVENIEEKFFRVLKRLGVRMDPKPWFNWTEQAGEEYTGKTPPCIKELTLGTEEGSRNEHGIRLASYFCNFLQATPNIAKKRLKEWNSRNNPPLKPKEYQTILSSAVIGGYNYGCTDDILKQYCKREECPVAPFIMTKLMTKEERKEAVKILGNKNLLDYIVDYGRRALIGEDEVILENFVKICSGQTSYAISGILKGFSGSGKNQSLKAIMPLIPKEWIYWFTTSTPEALKYLPSAFKGTLIIYEASGVRSDTGSLSLRAVGENQSIETIYPTRDTTTGKMILGTHKTNAQNFITTDAGIGIEPQLYRRVLQCSMNSSTQLTRRVIGKKIRDSMAPESLKKLLGKEERIPYTEKEIQNSLRVNDWNTEVIVLGGAELMKLMAMATNTEQEVALRTHIEKILNFVGVLALIQQRNRVRVLINNKLAYVFASPQDWVITIQTLESTIFETIARLGKRQQQVLDLCKTSENVNKHYIATELRVSTHTAARALKVLAQNGYLKEFKNTKPYHYELLREKPNQLKILDNLNEFKTFWLKSCKKMLKTICATEQRLNNTKITVEGYPQKQIVSNCCKIAQKRSEPKITRSGKTEQSTLIFSKKHSEIPT